MTFRTLILRSLRFHWRAHLGVVLGATVGSAALIGALVVGDSVRESLREKALSRLGPYVSAMAPSEAFFGRRLAGFLGYHRVPVAVALKLPGTVARSDGTARANRVEVLGVDDRFWSNTGGLRLTNLPERAVVINEALSRHLNARPGDAVILRLHKPSALSRDVPISPQDDTSVALRLTVAAIASGKELGDLSLRASQTPPLNAFVHLEELEKAVDRSGKVNLMLVGSLTHRPDNALLTKLPQRMRQWWLRLAVALSLDPTRAVQPMPLEKQADYLNELLAAGWELSDAGLSVVVLPELADDFRQAELHSSQIFLSPAVESAATNLTALTTSHGEVQSLSMSPPQEMFIVQQGRTNPLWHLVLSTNRSNFTLAFRNIDGTSAIAMPRLSQVLQPALLPRVNPSALQPQPLLTYLVNQLRSGSNTTPYSMVCAAGEPYTPAEMKDDEILVNTWLAEDLKVTKGDLIDLSYFLPESGAKLTETTNRFRVQSIVPLEGIHSDHHLMPNFPGLAKAASTHQWDAGFPLVHKIRDKDEEYWKQYRGTPKAFITLAAGQRMWANRFGNLTAIRFEIPPRHSTRDFQSGIERNFLQNLKPDQVGLRFEPVREQALKAANEAQDFGQLFLGFSFFLIAAALILMALLFQFGLEQRVTEVGTLLALGFTPRQVRRLFLGEGMALAAIGGVLGVAGGVGYAWAMLRGLATIWRDAVNASALNFHASGTTLVMGAIASVLVSGFTLWLTLRKLARRSARELLTGEIPSSKFQVPGSKFLTAALAFATAVGLLGWAIVKGETSNAGVFFGAGSLLLIAGIAFTASVLRRLASGQSRRSFTRGALGFRGTTRRRNRSVAVAGLLACGTFLIVAIGAFKMDANTNAWKRSSGTGGFALIGESTLPILRDLNTKEGREFYGLDDAALAGVSFVPMRVRDGDDASCLNLNRAQRPRLLGVSPELLSQRGAFSFATLADGTHEAIPWLSLQRGEFYPMRGQPLRTNEIAAIGDAASIQWAMGKKVGESLDYTDERGQAFKVRIVGAVANSILQGSLLIDEDEFKRRFPGESGYRMFLVDTPSNRVSEVSATLSRAFQDVGLELTPAARRLAQFNAVQNTYLNTFQVLGGLGLLLGSAGLGVVVLRNVLERRGELALLLAVGFRPRAIRRLVLTEHGALLVLGLAIGIAAALVAILPSVLSPAAEFPIRALAFTLAGLLGSGMLWTWLATWLALRGELLPALRNE